MFIYRDSIDPNIFQPNLYPVKPCTKELIVVYILFGLKLAKQNRDKVKLTPKYTESTYKIMIFKKTS